MNENLTPEQQRLLDALNCDELRELKDRGVALTARQEERLAALDAARQADRGA